MLTVLLVVLVGLLILVAFIPFDYVDIRWRTIRIMSKLPGPLAIPIIGLGIFIALLRDNGNYYYFCKFLSLLVKELVLEEKNH